MTANREPGIEPLTVELDESDIPGAMLSSPFERHRVPELKWWLLCRGIRPAVSMKKPQLIARYSVLQVKSVHVFACMRELKSLFTWVKILNAGFTKLCLMVQK